MSLVDLSSILSSDLEVDCHCRLPVAKPGALMCEPCEADGCTVDMVDGVNCKYANEVKQRRSYVRLTR